MKVLITGGFGFLGGRVAQFLSTEERHVIHLGSRQRTAPPSSLPVATVVPTQWASVESLEQICAHVDAVVHLAGMDAQACTVDPIAALELNGLATSRLLRASVRQGVKRFVYVSTAHVYASPLTGHITEETCPRNLHPYATSHRAGEDVVLAAHRSGELHGIVVRLSNAFGAPVDEGANCWSLLVNDLCRQAVATRRMVLRSSGLQRRDFIAMTDTCRAFSHLLGIPSDKIGDGLFNLGGGWSPTILEMTQRIADRVASVVGHRPEIVKGVAPEVPDESVLNYGITKLIASGYAPGPSQGVDREIDRLIRFCVRHPPQGTH